MGNAISIYAKFQLHPPYGFQDFTKIYLLFISHWQPIKLTDLDKSHLKHGGLLNIHFCKKKFKYPNVKAKIANFHFFHYKAMETISCHINLQSSYLILWELFAPSPPRDDVSVLIWKESASQLKRRSRLKMLKNVDGWTMEDCIYYKLTYGSGKLIREPSAQVS